MRKRKLSSEDARLVANLTQASKTDSYDLFFRFYIGNEWEVIEKLLQIIEYLQEE